MKPEDQKEPVPTSRQLMAAWWLLCRSISRAGQAGGAVDPVADAREGKAYADELLKQEPETR